MFCVFCPALWLPKVVGKTLWAWRQLGAGGGLVWSFSQNYQKLCPMGQLPGWKTASARNSPTFQGVPLLQDRKLMIVKWVQVILSPATFEIKRNWLLTLPIFWGKISQREKLSDCALGLCLNLLFCPKCYLTAFLFFFFFLSSHTCCQHVQGNSPIRVTPSPTPISQGSTGLFRACCGRSPLVCPE